MENAGYVGLSYQMALERKMNAIANNVANMDTTGYKSQHIQFKEYVSQTDAEQPLSLVYDYGEYKNFGGGAVTDTGNPLDIALVGNGFLKVRTVEGDEFYTRNGRLQIDNNNQLVTSSGETVLDQGGQAISIPDGESNIRITPEGTLAGKQGPFGQIGISKFQNPQLLEPVGNSLFKSSADPQPDPETRIQQGALEGSNVNPIFEMTNMMEVQRRYQSVARMLQTDHDRQRDAIRKLAETR
jgi:flagellar basal-body rod protein FlgF